MKKIFTLFAALMITAAVFAQGSKNYTEKLVVVVNDVAAAPQSATVVVTSNTDGTINFNLKNFVLAAEDGDMPVGNIAVENLKVSDNGKYKSFEYKGNITIAEGDAEGVEFWMGPLLEEIPIDLKGKMTDDNLYVTIDIPLAGQQVNVQLGDEETVTAKKYTENLVVTINDIAAPAQPATVALTYNTDGTINFTLKNFILATEDDDMPVGNIAVRNLALKDEGGNKSFAYSGDIVIEEGDAEGVPFWAGPALQEIPIDLKGLMNDEHLYVTIDIALVGQQVNVKLGTEEALSVAGVTIGNASAAYYTVNGVKVNSLQKGINIVKIGSEVKKVLVK